MVGIIITEMENMDIIHCNFIYLMFQPLRIRGCPEN